LDVRPFESLTEDLDAVDAVVVGKGAPDHSRKCELSGHAHRQVFPVAERRMTMKIDPDGL